MGGSPTCLETGTLVPVPSMPLLVLDAGGLLGGGCVEKAFAGDPRCPGVGVIMAGGW